MGPVCLRAERRRIARASRTLQYPEELVIASWVRGILCALML